MRPLAFNIAAKLALGGPLGLEGEVIKVHFHTFSLIVSLVFI